MRSYPNVRFSNVSSHLFFLTFTCDISHSDLWLTAFLLNTTEAVYIGAAVWAIESRKWGTSHKSLGTGLVVSVGV